MIKHNDVTSLSRIIGTKERVEARLIVCKLSQEVSSRRRAKLECTKVERQVQKI